MSGTMIITYDPEVDAAYIYLKGSIAPGEAHKQLRTPDPDIVLDFDAAGHLIGIELLRGALLHPALIAAARPLLAPEFPHD